MQLQASKEKTISVLNTRDNGSSKTRNLCKWREPSQLLNTGILHLVFRGSPGSMRNVPGVMDANC